MPYNQDETPYDPDQGQHNFEHGSNADYNSVAGWYREFLGREGSADEINSWLQSGQSLDAIRGSIQGSEEAKKRGATTTPPTDTTKPPPTTSTGRMDDAYIRGKIAEWAKMEGADPSLGSDPDYWLRRIKETGGLGSDNETYWMNAGVGPTAFFRNPQRESGGGGAVDEGRFPAQWPGAGGFKPPTPREYPTAPAFNPPAYTKPPPFVKPTLADAMAEPGYQFRLGEGERALEHSAAAKGVLNTGGTLKDVLQYGQDFASNEYGNVYNRAAADYMTNYGTQYIDPYNLEYKAAADQYAPLQQEYQNQYNTVGQQNTFDYNNAYSKWVQDYNIWRTGQSDAWGRYKDVLKP